MAGRENGVNGDMESRHPYKLDRGSYWLALYLDKDNPQTFLRATEACVAAMYRCSDRAGYQHQACINLKRFQGQIAKWADDEGLSTDALKLKLIQLLDAKETKFFQKDGRVTDSREVDALSIQIQALTLAMRHKGMIVDKSESSVKVAHDPGTILQGWFEELRGAAKKQSETPAIGEGPDVAEFKGPSES